MTDSDPGLAALDAIFTKMLIDEQWSTRDGRRFKWWSGPYCQEISASEVVLSHGVRVSRLMARTPIVTGVPSDERSYVALSVISADIATVSALVLGNDGVVSLVATAVVHEAISPWLPNHFALVSAIQIAEAQQHGPKIPPFLRGQPVSSAHPSSGPRHTPDDLTTIIDGLVSPQGQGPSRWRGASMAEALNILERTSLLANGDETGISAEFPYRNFSSLLKFETRERHPNVGAGLRVTLKLWSPPFNLSPPDNAVLLNLMEAKGLSLLSYLHGGWCVALDGDNNTVTFNAFFPDIFQHAGVASNVALWMSAKAQWVASLNDPRSPRERQRDGRPAIAYFLELFGLEPEEE
jgi:hypothetical protein